MAGTKVTPTSRCRASKTIGPGWTTLALTPAGRDVWRRAASNLQETVTALEARLERPAAEIQQVLRELHAAFDAELAAPGRPLSRR